MDNTTNVADISQLDEDLLQICISYIYDNSSTSFHDNKNELEAFGDTCKAFRKFSTYFCADRYIDCIAADVSVPVVITRYLCRHVTTEDHRGQIISHMIQRLKKKVFFSVKRASLPQFLRPYFSLIDSDEISSFLFHHHPVSISEEERKKMSIVVEYIETTLVMSCWCATNATLLSSPSAMDVLNNLTTGATGEQEVNPEEAIVDTSMVNKRELLLRSEFPVIVSCLMDQFILLDDIVHFPDISPAQLQSQLQLQLNGDRTSRLYLVVTNKHISSTDPIVMQIIKSYTEYYMNLTVVLDCREEKEEDGRSATELRHLPMQFRDVVRHLSILGKNIKRIADNFMSYSKTLTTLAIPNSVTHIGICFLYECEVVTNVSLPNSITSIGDRFLSKCTSLTTATIPNSISHIGNFFLARCPGLTTVNIPDSVNTIGDSFLYDCTGITTVKIPDSVTNIGDSFLFQCRGLTNVSISNSVTDIGSCFLFGCANVTTVSIPNSVTTISTYFLHGCTGLTTVTIPDSVAHIGGNFLSGCTNLTGITHNHGEFLYDCTSATIVGIPECYRSRIPNHIKIND